MNTKFCFDNTRLFKTQYGLNFSEKIIVDFFAGGGGASTGLEMGLNRPVYVAVNHNPKAVAMHEANHPHTIHYVQDVFAVDPVEICDGYQVGWFHASPDCTHHSQAAGGQPRKKEIRDLSWVVLKVAGKVRPDVISLENVKQILNWCPLIAKRDKATGRVVTLDRNNIKGKKSYRVAEPGEVVPRNNQFLVPNQKLKGKTWRHFVKQLEKLGYVVEWKLLRAADYGAPTTRERLFLIARCDGQPIVWPEPTHRSKTERSKLITRARKLPFWRTGAEIIDFTDLGKSIFDRPKPLADATLRRIARGLQKFVLDEKEPFFVESATPFISRDFGTSTGHLVNEPLATITSTFGGHSALISPIVAPFFTEFANASQQRNWSIEQPLTTICAQVKGGHHALVAPYLVHAGHGEGTPDNPRWGKGCDSIQDPLGTITTSGGRNIVSAVLSKENLNDALRVATFLINFYGNGDARDIKAPLDTLTTKDRLALVTVWIKGEPWVIVDIRMRMLKPRELFRAQGFPDSYVIEHGHDGKPLSKTDQVFMCGNSVSPLPMAAIARANDPFFNHVAKEEGAA
ncbi:DNA cytosine methyltransferase [Acinetobacter baumannii]|uniref:DNA cytosine methyltransferase n=1 Tax=Acinetobacter baumannii TaxID=470 RepID=UPI001045E5D5|nr:DNA cytosine methyltransferase [Acinetobacter baumannii]MBF6684250.1 DNA cytosine methyltransferase [Acinetobacter baumannii]MBF6693518.1 DNA cytosine methyltransferase [Acinetobacter baumannii]MBF6708578.1 DNA cytosine methyltransferase [Acinetobacter baumannii]MBF6775898.1 DNA cytosine methyltransferase [Acinetobacter baumannii]MBF6782238.1 DNA cytosine methyltransferase [Acinetobacter baumannii]